MSLSAPMNGQSFGVHSVPKEVGVEKESIKELKITSKSDSKFKRRSKKSKILVTLSEDMSYTLTIDGNTLSSVMDSISSDKDMKKEWNSWQRFVLKPKDFLVYIYDKDFEEYVLCRKDTPIPHLSKIKIKSKFYVNRPPLLIGHYYPSTTSTANTTVESVPKNIIRSHNWSQSSKLTKAAKRSTEVVFNRRLNRITTKSSEKEGLSLLAHKNINTNSNQPNPWPLPSLAITAQTTAPTPHLTSGSTTATIAASKATVESVTNNIIRSHNWNQFSELTKAAKKAEPTVGGGVKMENAGEGVSQVYVALLTLVKKYMECFETEKKNTIWDRIETEMRADGFTRKATDFRTMFYRLRYNYIKMKNLGKKRASEWPYFKYFDGLDLKAFPIRHCKLMTDNNRKQLKRSSKRKAQNLKPPLLVTANICLTNKTKTDHKVESSEQNQNNNEPYSDGQTSDSDLDGVENKPKPFEWLSAGLGSSG